MSGPTNSSTSRSRYVIGIDLGTSNCALSYVDTLADKPRSKMLSLTQMEGRGTTTENVILPSFLYLPPEAEDGIVGRFARDQLTTLPGRVVHSAKSWLCHAGVDRQEKLLPWGSEEISEQGKYSPVEASAKYLAQLREHWDETIGAGHEDYRFDNQEVTITVPASFDEVAQSLTLEAEKLAGFKGSVRLLEEPQAAFYYWLEKHSVGKSLGKSLLDVLPELANRPQTILICDIGGGTTDFSLFEVQPPASPRSRPAIKRTAVSDHILLGGDNIDLAIAHRLETGLGKLSPRQWLSLTSQCRDLKETLLSLPEGAPDETLHVSVVGEGASLFRNATSASISRTDLRALVLSGFFPTADKTERPRRSAPGLKEWGLPFAPDSAVTRHLAAFLSGRPVDAILFNGGSLKPTFLQQRLLAQVAEWQDGQVPAVLVNDEMDLAVARGAAFYGVALRSPSSRIRGGYAHSVFLELDAKQLVCLLPKGTEAGDALKIKKQRFKLLVDQPVRFQLFYANRREADKPGDLLPLDEPDLHPLPALQTEIKLPPEFPLPADRLIDIELETTISETGLLQLFCIYGEGARWQLDFNLRGNGDSLRASEAIAAIDTGVPEPRLALAKAKIDLFYGKKQGDVAGSPKALHRELEKVLHFPKEDWNLALLRSLWPSLEAGAKNRGRSPAHEAQWLYLTGFCLRPGYGAELDQWRMETLWKIFRVGVMFGDQHCRTRWLLLWRRVAGGLNASQQEEIAAQLVPQLRRTDATPEMMLLAGSLERLSASTKIQFAQFLLNHLVKLKTSASEAALWALGRIANRTPLYAGAQAALSSEMIAPWVRAVIDLDFKTRSAANVPLFLSQSCRITQDRNLDVTLELRKVALSRLLQTKAPREQSLPLEQFVPFDRDAQARLFGEAVPAGLQLA